MIARLVWMHLVLGVSIAAGCAAISEDASGIDDDFMDDPPPPGDCETECDASGTAGSPLNGPCLDTGDCAQGICVATFDGQVQNFTCQEQCVPLMDDTQWCADDQSCCDGMCSARGYCIPSALDGTSSDGSDSGSTGGADSSGTSGGTDSGSTGGSGTDSGSESGGSTSGSTG